MVIFPLLSWQVASSVDTDADMIALTVTVNTQVSVMGLPDSGIKVAV